MTSRSAPRATKVAPSNLVVNTDSLDIDEEGCENLNDSNKLPFNFHKHLPSPYHGKTADSSIGSDGKRVKSSSSSAWSLPFLPDISGDDEHSSAADEQAAALSSQVIGLLESPRGANQATDKMNHHDSSNRGVNPSRNADPRSKQDSSSGSLTIANEPKQPINNHTSDNYRSSQGRELPPAWTRYSPGSLSQQTSNATKSNESPGSVTSSGDEVATDLAQLNLEGSGPPMLRRVDSSELVRRAFPEMLFDRVSPSEESEHDMSLLGTSLGQVQHRNKISPSGERAQNEKETDVDRDDDRRSPSPEHQRSVSVSPASDGRFVSLGQRSGDMMLSASTPSMPPTMSGGIPPGFNYSGGIHTTGQQQQQQQQQQNAYDIQAQFYLYMQQQMMYAQQQQRQQDHMSGNALSPGLISQPLQQHNFVPLSNARPHSFGSGANHYGGVHNQSMYQQEQQQQDQQSRHVLQHSRAHSQFTQQNRSMAQPGIGAAGSQSNRPQMSAGHSRTRGGSEAGASWSRPVSPVPSVVCSSVLADHKHAGRRPGVNELRGHVLEFAKDSHGSRYLQDVMAAASDSERETLLDEVENDCLSVIQDLFGNYVMQNFLEHASPLRRMKIATRMKGVIVDLSMHPHGCRVVQKVLELLGPDEIRYELLEELIDSHGDLERTAKDAHATHVLQKAVVVLQRDVYPFLEQRAGRGDKFRRRTGQRSKGASGSAKSSLASTDPKHIALSKRLLKSVENVVAASVMELAVNQHACRLVQRVLGDCDRNRAPCISVMMNALESDYTSLSRDQHGNFILQHVLELGQQVQADAIQKYVSTRVVELSQHKFGSHLVEKCLLTASPQQASVIIAALIAADTPLLTKLMKDPYANFVLQRAFDVGNAKERSHIENEVLQRADVLSQTTSGRHILSHLSRSR